MSEIQQSAWSETANSNNASPPNGFPENMAPSGVNDSARENMAALKRDWNRSHPTVTSAGSSTAYTLTYTTAPAAYAQGLVFAFKVDEACGADPTVNVNSLGAKKVYKNVAGTPTQLVANDWYADQVVILSYDTALDGAAGGFHWLNEKGSQAAASEGTAGIAELATQTETNTGTDDARIVTPLKLTQRSPASATPAPTADKLFYRDATDSNEKADLIQTVVRSVSGTRIQSVRAASAATASGTAQFVRDDSIPQLSEGNELAALDCAITPTNASNVLEIELVLNVNASAGAYIVAALFQDSTANSLACAEVTPNTAQSEQIVLSHRMTAGTTSATTFKVRYGPTSGVTVYVNGDSSGRLYGGVEFSSLTVTEYAA